METNYETQLKFGDFETSVNYEPADDCVELPPCWLIEDVNEYELSFSMPSQCNGVGIPNEDKPLPQKIEFLGFEEIKQMPSQGGSNAVIKNSTNDIFVSNNVNDNEDDLKLDGEEKTVVEDLTSEANNAAVIDVNDIVSEPASTEETIESVADEKAVEDLSKTLSECNAIQESSKTEPRTENSILSKNVKEKSQPTPNAKPGNSWAGLFKSKENSPVSKMVQPNDTEKKTSYKSSVVPTSETKSAKSPSANGFLEQTKKDVKGELSDNTAAVKLEIGKHTQVLAKLLAKLDLKFKPQAFIPRGLINSSNWCFINATLQALLMCPPLYQLLKSLPQNKINNYANTTTPTIDCFVNLASEFHPLSTKKGYQAGRDLKQGSAFAPECVYEMLSATKSSLSDSGRQEDAEEFLSSALNGLHEEMVKLFQLAGDENDEMSKDSVKTNNESYRPSEKITNGSDEEEWEEVITTKRNRTAVTRRADTSKTPISKIFRGELCTSVFRPGQKLSISHEPFYCLPLAVPTAESERYWSVEDAMYALTNKENFYESDANQTACRQQGIEILPPILILHLKRFIYDKSGGSKKLDRKVDFKSDLIIPKDILSKTSKKYSPSQRTYKLFAVVCHHGERASGGHYSADVFHIGMSSWLRIDDQNIQYVSHGDVTRYNATRTPYLLFYRRTDLG